MSSASASSALMSESDMRRSYIGQIGWDPALAARAAAAGLKDRAYYGNNAADTAGKFKTAGVKQIDVDSAFGAALKETIEATAGASSQYLLTVLAGGDLGETCRVSMVPGSEIMLPFNSQIRDLGVATIKIESVKNKSGFAWIPIGGHKFLAHVSELVSKGRRRDAERLLRAAAALGMRKALAADGVTFSDTGVSKAMPQSLSLSNTAVLFSRFKSDLAVQKGQYGAARLIGAHPDEFLDSAASIQQYIDSGRIKSTLPGGLQTLAGKTAFPRRMADGTPIPAGTRVLDKQGCNAFGSGPGLTANFRFSPRTSKANTQYCGPTRSVNPASAYKMGSRVGADFSGKSMQSYIDSLRLASVPMQYTQDAYDAAKAPAEFQFYGNADNVIRDDDGEVIGYDRDAAAARVKVAVSASHKYAGQKKASASAFPAQAAASSSADVSMGGQ